ncbi:MAG TPA: hypothetical protein ENJ40_00120 [Thermosulfurimonas dismutans]|uniref:Uncharacterized protein n=1 Tax=Thermosulfurimonas dismutans TaxID=999894 RepID=A0A7C3CNF8_9BACT|nr:hypothetical protein [Thermosulfurimonas dismutans]
MNEDLARRNRLLIFILSVALAFLAGFGLGYLPSRNALLETRLELSLCRSEKTRCEDEKARLSEKQERVARILSNLTGEKDRGRVLSVLKTMLEVLK